MWFEVTVGHAEDTGETMAVPCSLGRCQEGRTPDRFGTGHSLGCWTVLLRSEALGVGRRHSDFGLGLGRESAKRQGPSGGRALALRRQQPGARCPRHVGRPASSFCSLLRRCACGGRPGGVGDQCSYACGWFRLRRRRSFGAEGGPLALGQRARDARRDPARGRGLGPAVAAAGRGRAQRGCMAWCLDLVRILELDVGRHLVAEVCAPGAAVLVRAGWEPESRGGLGGLSRHPLTHSLRLSWDLASTCCWILKMQLKV
mmetsp:Transcript_5665/g.21460  ORF Transcript_5665/g.21460 Transcript_5665/m.21460 type:complete len:258 (+) Transcript_5665:1247-2020(+)